MIQVASLFMGLLLLLIPSVSVAELPTLVDKFVLFDNCAHIEKKKYKCIDDCYEQAVNDDPVSAECTLCKDWCIAIFYNELRDCCLERHSALECREIACLSSVTTGFLECLISNTGSDKTCSEISQACYEQFRTQEEMCSLPIGLQEYYAFLRKTYFSSATEDCREQWNEVSEETKRRIRELLLLLDDDSFKVREAAARELKEIMNRLQGDYEISPECLLSGIVAENWDRLYDAQGYPYFEVQRRLGLIFNKG